MSRISTNERLLPSLLDRLISEPTHVPQETASCGLVGIEQIRKGLIRDLAALLSAHNKGVRLDAQIHPEACRSVLNFGITPVAGKDRSSLEEITHSIHQAILDFEPRLDPDKLSVEMIGSTRIDPVEKDRCITILISGEMWAQPAPISLLLETKFNLVTGGVSFAETD